MYMCIICTSRLQYVSYLAGMMEAVAKYTYVYLSGRQAADGGRG
jgi:hypothetical protein